MDARYYVELQDMIRRAGEALRRYETSPVLSDIQPPMKGLKDIAVACCEDGRIHPEIVAELGASERGKFEEAIARLSRIISYTKSPSGNISIHDALSEVGRVAKRMEKKKEAQGKEAAHQVTSRAMTVAKELEAEAMVKTIERLELSIESDPDLAIGTAKELVESCCKTILGKLGVTVGKGDDVGDLTHKLSTQLRLVPKGVTDEMVGAENIRKILGNLNQLPHHLAQLRGLYGTGHGRDGKHKGLQSHHARLAAAAAVAFVDFVTAIYVRNGEPDTPTDTGL
jgi:hypothetical protein